MFEWNLKDKSYGELLNNGLLNTSNIVGLFSFEIK